MADKSALKYLIATGFGAITGAAIFAAITKAIPKMMSEMMANMMAGMTKEGCSPSEI